MYFGQNLWFTVNYLMMDLFLFLFCFTSQYIINEQKWVNYLWIIEDFYQFF